MNVRFGVRHLTVVIASAIAICVPFAPKTGAVRAGEYQPITVVTKSCLTPGNTLPLDIQLQGPATVHVYSDPVGAVSYDGDIDGTEATVDATTSSTGSTGTVTVYVETDGETVVSTNVTQNPGGPVGIVSSSRIR
jgi:hypothetical protein